MLAILCPGQGAQTPGFLRPWLELDSVRATLAQLSTRAYVDLAELGSSADADVVDTAVAQPLIVAAGLATGALLGAPSSGCVVVGHSVGELTAAAVAGMVTPAAAVDLARERGRAMAAAATRTPSGMTAVLGGDAGTVVAAIDAAGCWVANHNTDGQIVAAGSRAALQRLAATPPPGARLRALAVAGAFHTPLMEPASATVAAAVETTGAILGTVPVVSNADGATTADGVAFLRSVAAQLTRPVRFDRCLDTLRALGVTATIELAPAGVLTAIVRRALPQVEPVALRTPDDLGAAHRLLADHTGAGEPWTEPWRLVVAPVAGTVDRTAAGGSLAVRTRDGSVPVPTSGDHDVIEWLADDGDPVSPGQPLARVLPAAR